MLVEKELKQTNVPRLIQTVQSLPPSEIRQQLLIEVAVMLYALEQLSFGQARQLANLDHRQFATSLGDRNIPRHYDETSLAQDLEYVNRQSHHRDNNQP